MLKNLWKILYIVLIFLFCGQHTFARAAKHIFTLVIDAGHGGHDSGAVGASSKEKDINLRVALAFGRLVETNCPDVKIVYTRKTDVFIPLQRRADIANSAKANLFISVHTNALPGGRIAYGSETYSLGMARADENLAVAKRENSVITLESDYKQTYNGFDPNKAESYVIFEIMQNRYMQQSVDLASCIQKEYAREGRPNKGVHQAGFLVLRNTSMPSVLTELGFITTPAEEEYLNSSEGVEQLSRSIFNGFLAYLKKHGEGVSASVAAMPRTAGGEAESPVRQSSAAGGDVAVVPVSAVRSKDLAQPSSKEQASAREERTQPESRPAEKKQKQPSADSKPVEKKQANAAKKTQTKASSPKTEKGKSDKTKNTQQSKPKKNRVTYRIQVGAGKVKIEVSDPQFKGLKVERVREGSFYKYFYGSYATYSAAQKGLRAAQAKMPGSYMVAYVDGKPVSVKEAREKEK